MSFGAENSEMKFLIFIVFMFLSPQIFAKECVVLMHGYKRTGQCLDILEKALISQGYLVQNITYPTTQYSIEQIAKDYVAPQIRSIDCDKVHFVGHSMGGIVIRKYLSYYTPENLGNVVLITTPNKGSEAVSKLKNWPFFESILGPAAMDLEVGSNLLQSLPDPNYNVGIIRATKPKISFISLFLDGDNHDGVISYDAMLLDKENDVVDIYTTHNRILLEPDLEKYVSLFLKFGSFSRETN